MSEHKYSLTEIDEMRWCVKRLGETEDQLRTYMVNGTTLAELKDFVDAKYREAEERRKAQRTQRLKEIRACSHEFEKGRRWCPKCQAEILENGMIRY